MAHVISLAVFLQEYFEEHDEVSPNEVLTAYRKVVKQYNKERRKRKQAGSYLNVAKYFYILRRLGLIKFTRAAKPGPNGPPIPRRYYRAVKARRADPRWLAPQKALYPQTSVGGRKYRRKTKKQRGTET